VDALRQDEHMAQILGGEVFGEGETGGAAVGRVGQGHRRADHAGAIELDGRDDAVVVQDARVADFPGGGAAHDERVGVGEAQFVKHPAGLQVLGRPENQNPLGAAQSPRGRR
jgi:hypothetical protein